MKKMKYIYYVYDFRFEIKAVATISCYLNLKS